jgi:hypothetical protein
MIVIVYQVQDQVKVDVFHSEKAQVFSRAGFVEVKDGHETVAAYNPNHFICYRKLKPEELAAAHPVPTKEPLPNDEAVHPGDRPEGQQDSPDRGSAG